MFFSFLGDMDACENQLLCIFSPNFGILFALGRKQDKAQNHKEREGIEAGSALQSLMLSGSLQMFYKHFSFVYCFLSSKHRESLILIPKQPHSRGERARNNISHSPFHTHSNLDAASISGHNMHSFQTMAHSLCTKATSRPAASI